MAKYEDVIAMSRCYQCNKLVGELCNDGVCRKCHVSLTFEDCVSGRWAAEVRRTGKIPPEPKRR